MSAPFDASLTPVETAPPDRGLFSHPAFVVILTASTFSAVGAAMFDTASSWLMTSLNPDPMIVSAVQVATTLPMFLLTIPAGAVTDILDSRRILIAVEVLVCIVATIFLGLVHFELVTPALLLGATFVLGACGALSAPAWLTITPQLVPTRFLDAATAANSAGYNISRAVGPALGGLAIAAIGISWPFLAYVVGNFVVLGALLWWRPARKGAESLPAERLTSAVRSGLRYVAYSRHMRDTMARALGFFFFSGSYWALLPLVARHQMRHGPEVYGALVAAIGVGSLIGSLGLNWLKARFGPDALTVLGTVGTVVALVMFGFCTEPVLALSACLLAGASWIVVLATLFTSAQVALPEWVRARGLAVFLTAYFGAMALGGIVWGKIASSYGLAPAMFLAAAGALIALPLTWRYKLQTAAGLDLTPSLHWGRPVLARKIDDRRGPVLVSVEYRIEPQRRTMFLDALEEIGHERKRDGAYAWGVFEDAADVERVVETFLLESWLELMHLRERVTNSDREFEAEVRKLFSAPPKISFLVAPKRSRKSRRRRRLAKCTGSQMLNAGAET